MFPASVFPVIAMCAALAPYVSPFDPRALDFASVLDLPSGDHLFGTDQFGRDVFARTLFGLRVSVVASIGTIAAMLLFDRVAYGMHPYLFVAVGSAVILAIEAFIVGFALIPEPTPTIGSLIVQGLHAEAPWMVFPPAVVLLATSLFASSMANTLRIRLGSGGW